MGSPTPRNTNASPKSIEEKESYKWIQSWIEGRQLGNADRLEACLAIDLVVAWRVMYLVHLNREIPGMPATSTPTLGEVVTLVATLDGHLGRKSDGQPGAEVIMMFVPQPRPKPPS